ncbi:class I SAM-dependent methyltransferase [Trichococcus ilyis]|jgi:16S rRNA (guanine1207-N2)-methyltransferase|uniref:16S rRNA (Guanine1207-N2)-methyltransferase n=1 Tax=Trichococcus ilyis TaxID=640938 RepID=A0A143YQH3_9LACT|nr:class I SAM-dependent methyltransferase [Trichococcus ilyis]CZQ96127.1 s-adenosyl-l-methionine-dependent methyltransferase [Trichococcus ilyis]SEJ79748.1 16S rRNA (guanine1207-N2)-methyltransferase [Trichococcus ilyis]
MSNHYYTKNPETESKESSWNFRLRDRDFRFISDSGVFSKKTVDFGSRLLIETVQLPDEVAGDILDVGCGYGPMGLALAHAYPERLVEMVDVNERAMSLARRNAEANNIRNVKIYESNTYDQVPQERQFAAIVSNPPIRAGKQVVHRILSEAHGHLLPGGTLTVVIQKKQGAPSAEQKMLEVFGNAEVVARDKGYWIIQSVKA